MKQLLSLLLAICLMVTMVSVSAVSAGAASVDTQTSTGEVEQFPNSMYVDFTNVLDAPGSYWFAWTWDSNGNAKWRTIEEFGYVGCVFVILLFILFVILSPMPPRPTISVAAMLFPPRPFLLSVNYLVISASQSNLE